MTHFTADDWREAKDLLRHTLTKSTFERFVAPAELLSANGRVQIAVSTPRQRDWLEHRLKTPVLRALNSLITPPLTAETLEFVVRNGSAPLLPPEAEPAAGPELPDFYRVWQKTGYSAIAHYVTRFWIPFLSPIVFAVWKAIESTDSRPVKNIENRWTRPREYTFRHLARTIGLTSRHPVSGAKRECGVSLHARQNGSPISTTCSRCPHSIHRLEADVEGVLRCKFWRPGALEILAREKLLALEVSQSTPAENSRLFRLSVYRMLPILTPTQVAALPQPLHREHARWLAAHHATVGLTPDDWQQISIPTLVSAQPGYVRHKPLDGRYEFNRLLIDIQENTKVVS